MRRSFKSLAEKLAGRLPDREGRRALFETLGALRDQYKAAARQVDELGLPQWKPQIVHSDWHPGNMLFDRGHVVAVIDFDAARIQPRVVDIANGTLQFSLVTGGRDRVALLERKDEKLKGYSGGMKQRVGIATALLHLPRIIVVDEPTAGLDPKERIRFRNLLAELAGLHGGQ